MHVFYFFCALFAVLSPLSGLFFGMAFEEEDSLAARIVLVFLATTFTGLATSTLVLLLMVVMFFYCPQAVRSR